MIRVVGNGLVVFSALLAWMFVVLYHRSAPWWRTEVGRHLMTFMAVLGAVLTLAVVRLLGLEAVWFDVVRTVVFAGVPAVFAWRIWILIRANFRRKGPQ